MVKRVRVGKAQKTNFSNDANNRMFVIISSGKIYSMMNTYENIHQEYLVLPKDTKSIFYVLKTWKNVTFYDKLQWLRLGM